MKASTRRNLQNAAVHVRPQQTPLDMKTGEVIRGPIEAEKRSAMERIRVNLKAAGCTFEDVAKCTCASVADSGAMVWLREK